MPPEGSVRHATMEDIPRVVELWYEMQKLHEPMGAYFILKPKADCDLLFSDYLEDALEHPRENRIMVFELADGNIVGYCHATLVSRPPVYAIDTVLAIDSIAVTESYRRHGIGRLLCEDIFRFADNLHLSIELEAHGANKDSIAFYLGVGFHNSLWKMDRYYKGFEPPPFSE